MLRIWGLVVVGVTLVVMIATEPRLAMVWDEGYTLGREARMRSWFQALSDPAKFASTWQAPSIELVQEDRPPPPPTPPPRPEQINERHKLFEPEVIRWFWPFAREEPHGHPPFYAIVGMIGDLVAPTWATLPRARFGPMLAFSITAGALFVFVARRWGPWPGGLAACAWVLQPNLFANGHYATLDALLSSLWLLALLAFAEAVDAGEQAERRFPRWGWVLVFGILAGWAADTKLTGWFLPFPMLAWSLLERSRRGLLTLIIGGMVASVTLYVFNPCWWSAPIEGVQRFLVSNLTRGKTIPIPVLFLGQIYHTPNQSLPWYNTLVWTALVTPVGFLGLALAGAVRVVRRWRKEPLGILALGHWAFLLLLRALPHTPGHDGVRQMLPAFGILALMAGLGAASLVERFQRAGKGIIAAATLEGILGLALMMPVPLSYFSPIIGGLPGAVSVGMEPTYFWDGLSEEALTWLNQHTPQGQKVAFATNPTSWLYLQAHGKLRVGIHPRQPGAWAWYVIQNRPGAFSPWDRALVDRGHPAYVVKKWGVPLVWIYPYAELERSLREIPGQ